MSVPLVRWKVELVGEREELQGLAKMFPVELARAVTVWCEDGKYYVHAPEFEEMSDAEAVLKRGEVIAGRLNGLGLLKFRFFRPVTTGSVRSGNTAHLIIPTAHLYLTGSALQSYILYSPDRPPDYAVEQTVNSLPPVEEWSVSKELGSDIDEALGLFTIAVRAEDWRLLAFVYEIIADHFGQPSKVVRELRNSTASEITRFSDTANSRLVLGDKARHGRRKHPAKPPPANPMVFTEAVALVRGLLLAWLKYESDRGDA